MNQRRSRQRANRPGRVIQHPHASMSSRLRDAAHPLEVGASSDHASSPHAHRTGHYALGQVLKARHPGSWPVHIPHLSCTQLSIHSSARLTIPALAAASQQYEGIYSNLHASCPRRSSCPSLLMSPLSVRIACSTHPARTERGQQTHPKVIPGSPRDRPSAPQRRSPYGLHTISAA